jgi:hemoglobin/transferrin/lactoferrin receptor protein
VLRGMGGQRVLVLMDGVPMNSARGNGPHPSLVDPSQTDRVEVARGPSAAAYGSDALGGVINIITREAPPAPDGTRGMGGGLTLGGSSADKGYTGSVDLIPRIGKFSAFLSAGVRHADDFKSPDGTVPHSAFKDYNSLFNLRYDLSPTLALKGGYQMSRGNSIGIPGLSSPTQDFGPGNITHFKFDYYDRDYAHVALDHKYGSTWLASSHMNVYWQREQRNFYSDENIDAAYYPIYGINFDPSSAGSSSRQTNQDRFFNLNTYGAQIQFASVKTSKYFFTSGIDIARDVTGGDYVRKRYYNYTTVNGDSAGAISYRTTKPVPDGHFDNYAAYFQNETYLNPKWTLSAGLRYTQYNYKTYYGMETPTLAYQPTSLNKGAPSGSLGLVFSPQTDLHLSFNVANGYRQPNAQDLYFRGAASVGFVIGNPDLTPEKSISYDAGVRWGPGPLAFSGSLFYTTYDDLIDAVNVAPTPDTPPGLKAYQYVNITKARTMGAEGEMEWRIRTQWNLRAAATTMRGDDTDKDVPLPNIPPFKGSASLRWTSTEGTYWIEPSTRYSWRTNNLPPPTPGVSQLTDFKKEWIVGDIFVGARFSNNLRASAGVRNFTDRSYRMALGSLVEPGVSFVASLTSNF